MDLIDQIKTLSARLSTTRTLIQTEEATKTAMVLPFIQLLGYNVFDPTEVTPELIADIGTKKGEKVDYAILRDGKPIMLVECKKCGGELNINHASQLFRYFHVTSARFGVLTNGLSYQFFTDLEQPNKMDDKPFFEFDILNFKERDIEELKKFAKSIFDVESILNTASDLKYTRGLQTRLTEWIAQPPEELVKLLAYEYLPNGKRFTPALIDQFSRLTKRAFEQLLNARINDRLQGALVAETASDKIDEEPESKSEQNQIITTDEEIEGLHIVRSILRDVVSPRRIVMRDNQSYCAILLDDNNRKPVCRLRFNNTEKLAIGIFGANKEETKFQLQHIDDLYNYASELRSTLAMYGVQNESS